MIGGCNRESQGGFQQGVLKTLLLGGAARFWRRGGLPSHCAFPLGETGKGDSGNLSYAFKNDLLDILFPCLAFRARRVR